MCEFVHVSATFWANGWEGGGQAMISWSNVKLILDKVLINFPVMYVNLKIDQIENYLTAFL